jgi:ornithine decarboxylase
MQTHTPTSPFITGNENELPNIDDVDLNTNKSKLFLNTFINKIINDKSIKDEAFFICDLGEIERQYNRWLNCLPRVTPYYAVKCFDDIEVIRTLFKLGAGFDCASLGEIEKVLSVGTPTSKIIYANSCKLRSHLEYAAEKKVDVMTVDNKVELIKIKELYPEAKLVLRIQVDDSKSVIPLGRKFGIPSKELPKLISFARELNLNLVGVSFHVGCNCKDATAYYQSIQKCREVFDLAAEFGYEMELVDIGGGYSGNGVNPECPEAIELEELAIKINHAIDEFFPDLTKIKIISEPGRYFANSLITACNKIFSKREIYENQDEESTISSMMYYIPDGAFHSFMGLSLAHMNIPFPKVLRKNNMSQIYDVAYLEDVSHQRHEEYFESIVWGPTCDSYDVVFKSIKLPLLEIGDWLIWCDWGAYTLSITTKFNGFDLPRIFYINTKTI